MPQGSDQENSKYTKAQLYLIAFDIVYSKYFKVVDNDGKALENRFKNFEYESLSDEEATVFDEYYDSIDEYCVQLYEEITGEKYQ